jgi:putative YphP/YqiW family bacilliredoxin
MRQELTQLGVRELKTAAEVDAVLGGQRTQPGDQHGPTVMVVVNSVCGCAAGKARPGIAIALQHETKPEIVATVFAGADLEATDRARSYFTGEKPSSPQVAIVAPSGLQARSRIAYRSDTALLSVILANNETGVVQDAAKLAERAHARGVPVHFDATQAVGKLPVDAVALGADLLSGTAHKLNGPKGTGFLVERMRMPLPALVRGGPQERRRRGGTENVAGIVGLGVACALARAELAARHSHVSALRDALWRGLEAAVPRVRRNGDPAHVLPNTLSVEFEDTAGEVLLEALDLEGVAVSAGAACHSGSIEPSAILLAMGRTEAQARGSLRFSVGPGNTAAEIAHVLALLPALVARVREAGA